MALRGAKEDGVALPDIEDPQVQAPIGLLGCDQEQEERDNPGEEQAPQGRFDWFCVMNREF
jgi:hypothetical protein